MLAKLTVRNQLTIPKDIADRYPGVEYFDVSDEQGKIILTPLRKSRADEVREQLRNYGITGDDVEDAVSWERSTRTTS